MFYPCGIFGVMLSDYYCFPQLEQFSATLKERAPAYFTDADADVVRATDLVRSAKEARGAEREALLVQSLKVRLPSLD